MCLKFLIQYLWFRWFLGWENPRIMRPTNSLKFLVQYRSSIHLDWTNHRGFVVALPRILKPFLKHLPLFYRGLKLRCLDIFKFNLNIIGRVFGTFFYWRNVLELWGVLHHISFRVFLSVRLNINQELWLFQINFTVDYFERVWTRLWRFRSTKLCRLKVSPLYVFRLLWLWRGFRR